MTVTARSARYATWFAVFVWLTAVPSGAAARAPVAEADASAIKAAFLYRFRSYVRWPVPADAEFTLAVLGDEALAAQLRRFVDERPGDFRHIRVRPVRSAREARDAHVLFIGATENERLRMHVQSLADRPVLVVSDAATTLAAGQTINFVVSERRIRFEVSLAAAERAGLRIDAGLLNVAARVEGTTPGTDATCGRATCDDRSLLSLEPAAVARPRS